MAFRRAAPSSPPVIASSEAMSRAISACANAWTAYAARQNTTKTTPVTDTRLFTLQFSPKPRSVRPAILALVALLIAVAEARAVDYAELRARAVKACEAIDPSDSQSGLMF